MTHPENQSSMKRIKILLDSLRYKGFRRLNVKMDRHHLLSLLDKIQEKYDIKDGDYKEFIEAIGGKKKILEFEPGDMVKVEYDRLETRAEFGDDDVYPIVNVTDKCSRIWKVSEDEHDRHVHNFRNIGFSISHKCFERAEIHQSEIKKLSTDLRDGFHTLCSQDRHQVKHVIRIRDITKI